jgi:hypothetical protein
MAWLSKALKAAAANEANRPAPPPESCMNCGKPAEQGHVYCRPCRTW